MSHVYARTDRYRMFQTGLEVCAYVFERDHRVVHTDQARLKRRQVGDEQHAQAPYTLRSRVQPRTLRKVARAPLAICLKVNQTGGRVQTLADGGSQPERSRKEARVRSQVGWWMQFRPDDFAAVGEEEAS